MALKTFLLLVIDVSCQAYNGGSRGDSHNGPLGDTSGALNGRRGSSDPQGAPGSWYGGGSARQDGQAGSGSPGRPSWFPGHFGKKKWGGAQGYPGAPVHPGGPGRPGRPSGGKKPHGKKKWGGAPGSPAGFGHPSTSGGLATPGWDPYASHEDGTDSPSGYGGPSGTGGSPTGFFGKKKWSTTPGSTGAPEGQVNPSGPLTPPEWDPYASHEDSTGSPSGHGGPSEPSSFYQGILVKKKWSSTPGYKGTPGGQVNPSGHGGTPPGWDPYASREDVKGSKRTPNGPAGFAAHGHKGGDLGGSDNYANRPKAGGTDDDRESNQSEAVVAVIDFGLMSV